MSGGRGCGGCTGPSANNGGMARSCASNGLEVPWQQAAQDHQQLKCLDFAFVPHVARMQRQMYAIPTGRFMVDDTP